MGRIADECQLDTDLSEEARALHRVVRAMHDGHCPNCGNLAASEEFYRGIDYKCPNCDFTISLDEAEDALSTFLPRLQQSMQVFLAWRARRTSPPASEKVLMEDTPKPFAKVAADKLAHAVALCIDRGVLDARSKPADALLDYLEIGQPGGFTTVHEWVAWYEGQRGASQRKRSKDELELIHQWVADVCYPPTIETWGEGNCGWGWIAAEEQPNWKTVSFDDWLAINALPTRQTARDGTQMILDRPTNQGWGTKVYLTDYEGECMKDGCTNKAVKQIAWNFWGTGLEAFVCEEHSDRHGVRADNL